MCIYNNEQINECHFYVQYSFYYTNKIRNIVYILIPYKHIKRKRMQVLRKKVKVEIYIKYFIYFYADKIKVMNNFIINI